MLRKVKLSGSRASVVEPRYFRFYSLESYSTFNNFEEGEVYKTWSVMKEKLTVGRGPDLRKLTEIDGSVYNGRYFITMSCQLSP